MADLTPETSVDSTTETQIASTSETPPAITPETSTAPTVITPTSETPVAPTVIATASETPVAATAASPPEFKVALDQLIAARRPAPPAKPVKPGEKPVPTPPRPTGMELRIIIPQDGVVSMEIQNGDVVSTYAPTVDAKRPVMQDGTLHEMLQFITAEFDASARKLGIETPSPRRY